MLIYISKTLLFILITIYTHVSFSAQPSKFHCVIGGQLHNEIQSAYILETSIVRTQSVHRISKKVENSDVEF